MKAKKRLSRLIRLQKAQEICDLYSQGKFTIASCCKAVGIPYDTFKDWAQPNISKADIENGNVRKGFIPEVNEMYKRSLIVRDANYTVLLENAVKASLLRLINGEEVEEVTTFSKPNKRGKMKRVRQRIVKKVKLPNVNAVMFVAKALDPAFSPERKSENSKINIEISGLSHLSLEELMRKKEELIQQLNSESDL